MNRGYLLGIGLGLALIAGGWWFLSPRFVPPPASIVAFATPLLDRSDAPIAYGHSADFVLQLQNRGNSAVRVDGITFDKPFASLGEHFSLPQVLAARSTVSIPVRMTAEKPHWGQYEITAIALVTNRRGSQPVSTMILCHVAAHLNPDPPVVQFHRVKRTAVVPVQTVRLWSPSSLEPLADCEVESNDPAVRVSIKPVQSIERGRRNQWELSVAIDAGQAQPQHRSQIVVRAGKDLPPVVIPVVGWVED
ncbi:MAG TPA: hypothetical protein VFG20_05100 [Planctomycetaceae bacterium]|nr:hypothetical protein [Planctomycetaceae bacterium]